MTHAAEFAPSSMHEIDDMARPFDANLVPGSIKAAQKEAGASSSDLWKFPVDMVFPMDGFNLRVLDERLEAHIENLTRLILANGLDPSKPLKGVVVKRNDMNRVEINDGYCRLTAIHRAIARGAEIEHVWVVVEKNQTIEDMTYSMINLNDAGKPLTALEVAYAIKRQISFGQTPEQIANRLNYSINQVNAMLALVHLPLEIRQMVQGGQVSATLATETVRAHGEKALALLKEGLATAKAQGKTKVTTNALPGKRFERALSRRAVEIYSTVSVVKQDPAYAQLSEDTRSRIEALETEIAALRAKSGVTTTETGDADAQLSLQDTPAAA